MAERWEEIRSEILEIDHLRGELRKVIEHSGKLTDALRQCRKRLKQVARPAYETRREALLEAADQFDGMAGDYEAWQPRGVADELRRMAEEATDG